MRITYSSESGQILLIYGSAQYNTMQRLDNPPQTEAIQNPSVEPYPSNAAQRVLDMAEHLFMKRGYNAITLRDIANELGIKQASLYYHFPDGKEQLFVAVAERVFARHKLGIEKAIDGAGSQIDDQLHAVAHWFASQPPVNLIGMMHADMPALSPEQSTRLTGSLFHNIFGPLQRVFHAARHDGQLRALEPNMMTGAFLALMDGMTISHQQAGMPPISHLADTLIDMFMNGLKPSEATIHSSDTA